MRELILIGVAAALNHPFVLITLHLVERPCLVEARYSEDAMPNNDGCRFIAPCNSKG